MSKMVGAGGFAAGVDARAVDGDAIGRIMAGIGGFVPLSTAPGPRDPAEPAGEPRHFRPATPGANPTAGWDMFDPDSVGDVPRPVPTAAQCAIEAARAEGYALGLAAGEQAARAEAAANADALNAIVLALAALRPFDRDALAERLGRTVIHLVEQLLGESLPSPDRLLARVGAAAAMLSDTTQPGILRLHPADLALIEGRVPEPLFAVADPALARGALVIETKDTVVEDGPATWIAALSAALERMPLPPC